MPKKRTNKKNKDTKNIKKKRYQKRSKRSNRKNKRNKYSKKGGFQKKMGNDYEIMSKHENDCAACVLKYFGAPQEVIDQVTSSSEYDPVTKTEGTTEDNFLVILRII